MSLIPLTILGIIIYNQTTSIFTQNVQEFLLTIVQSKDAALESYIDATETIGLSLAESDAMQTYIRLVDSRLDSADAAQFETSAAQVENLLYSIQEAHWGKYHHIFLIDSSQKIVISPNHGVIERGSPSSHLNEDTSTNQWAVEAFSTGTTTISDYSSWIESDHSHQMLFVPVKDSDDVTKAVIGFELQIPYEQEILTANFELGESGRVFLATLEGVPIIYQGIEEQRPLNTPGVAEAQEKGVSFGRRANAEGVDVIDVYLKNNTHPWILVAEIESQEAFGSLRAIQITMTAGIIITLILAVIFSVVLANFIVNPIIHLTRQMEEVSLGNLDIKIDNADRDDEIGQLIQAFNRIVKSLKIAMKGFKKK